MRPLFLAALAALFVSVSSAADLTLVRVWPGFRTAESFERISEYFGKDEAPETKLIFRSQRKERAGYYFLVRLKNSGVQLDHVRFEFQVISPADTEAKTYTFECAIPSGSHAFQFGLTGTDWPGKPKEESVAWQLRVLSSSGTELLRTQSFLWSQPDKK